MSACTRSYASAEQARVVAAQMGRKHGVQFAVEACSHCGKWHVRKAR